MYPEDGRSNLSSWFLSAASLYQSVIVVGSLMVSSRTWSFIPLSASAPPSSFVRLPVKQRLDQRSKLITWRRTHGSQRGIWLPTSGSGSSQGAASDFLRLPMMPSRVEIIAPVAYGE